MSWTAVKQPSRKDLLRDEHERLAEEERARRDDFYARDKKRRSQPACVRQDNERR